MARKAKSRGSKDVGESDRSRPFRRETESPAPFTRWNFQYLSSAEGIRLWGPFAALAALAFLFFGRILISSPNEMINTPDIVNYFRWLHQYSRDRMISGHWPLWNPYVYGGVPFAANPQNSVFYPLSYFYFLMPVIHAHKFMIVGHAVLAGWFMYLFLRRLGPGRMACMIGTLPYMMGGYISTNAAIGHLPMLFTMTWFPLVLYFCDRAVTGSGWRAWICVGASLGIQFLAGEPQNSYYTAMATVLYSGIRAWSDTSQPTTNRLQRLQRAAVGAGMAGILAALLGAIQLLPTAELAAHSDRQIESYSFSAGSDMTWSSILGLLVPWSGDKIHFLVVNPQGWKIGSWFWEWPLYLGIIIWLPVMRGLFLRGLPVLSAAKWLWLIGIILTCGSATPIYRLIYTLVPGFKLFRVPSRAVIIVILASGILAAFGAEKLFENDGRQWRLSRWRKGACCVAALAALGLMLAPAGLNLYYMWYIEKNKLTGVALNYWSSLLIRPAFIVTVTFGFLASAGWFAFDRRRGLIGMAGILAADLLLSQVNINLAKGDVAEDPSYRFMREIRDKEKDAPLYRADFASSHFDSNAAMAAGLENLNSYWPVSIGRYYRFVNYMRGKQIDLGERYLIPDDGYKSPDPFPHRILNARYASVWNAETKLFETTEAKNFSPRAWIVEQAEVIADEATSLAHLKSPEFKPSAAVILESPPQITLNPSNSPLGGCDVKRVDDHEIEIMAETTRNSYLVLSEIFYPGWKAEVDGHPVKLERANYCITAMPLPPGRHVVRYYYSPASFKLGACISALTVLGMFGVLMFGGRATRS